MQHNLPAPRHLKEQWPSLNLRIHLWKAYSHPIYQLPCQSHQACTIEVRLAPCAEPGSARDRSDSLCPEKLERNRVGEGDPLKNWTLKTNHQFVEENRLSGSVTSLDFNKWIAKNIAKHDRTRKNSTNILNVDLIRIYSTCKMMIPAPAPMKMYMFSLDRKKFIVPSTHPIS